MTTLLVLFGIYITLMGAGVMWINMSEKIYHLGLSLVAGSMMGQGLALVVVYPLLRALTG